jgi:predicted nucleic acid-binding Zn finger protein
MVVSEFVTVAVFQEMEVKKLLRELSEHYRVIGTHSTSSLASTSPSIDNEIDDILRSYLFILNHQKELLQRAIILLDDTEILKIESQTSKRHFWIIKGVNRKTYRVLDSYCPCRSYLDQIQTLGREEALCKHLIAISLGTSLHKIESRSLGNEDFIKMLSES